jgi:hypothetical protein
MRISERPSSRKKKDRELPGLFLPVFAEPSQDWPDLFRHGHHDTYIVLRHPLPPATGVRYSIREWNQPQSGRFFFSRFSGALCPK